MRPAWVMGILNVTPDSFSDGGLYFDPGKAVERALQQINEGARIIDVGAESTRPGSSSVPADEQVRRAVPVIEAIRSRDKSVPISIDTTSAEVAHAAIQAGANLVNDTSALRDDPALAKVVADSGASIILMHRRGTPRDMQMDGGPVYENLVDEIASFLAQRIEIAIGKGIATDKIAVDPGIGFGKRGADNFTIVNETDSFAEFSRPVVIGASRKEFIGDLLGISEPRERLLGSIACAAVAAVRGASIIRAHDVQETVECLHVVQALTDSSTLRPCSD